MSILFCDVVGSTAFGERLDAEALRAVMHRYFETARGIVERHGGTLEKFIGDAVVAVFGVPELREDDALRAVRAASELRHAFLKGDVSVRVGVNTGEVVTGSGETLGDAFNVAARLQQVADPGEVLIGAGTLPLVRAAVEVEATKPLAVKGKTDLLTAYRLLAVHEVEERPTSVAMVGRGRELGRLLDVFEEAVEANACELATLLGVAGVGKSRLTSEFVTALDERATIVRGRCLSYGEGITYWPLVDALKQLPALSNGTSAAEQVIQRMVTATPPVPSAEEIAWATRKRFEDAAVARPLVVIFEDLHWAEETLLDLIDQTAELSRDAAIMLLCIARPELLDRRPTWGGGKLNASTTLLQPLKPDDTDALIDELLDGDPLADADRDRVKARCEGNPLFIREMLAFVREDAGEVRSIPATINALLAARIEHLGDEERVVLEVGSVEGRVFHEGAVSSLLAVSEDQLATAIARLVKRELIRPAPAEIEGEQQAYRIHHDLIRDAAYQGIPKTRRAGLHEQLAAWLSSRSMGARLDAIVGYHLEQAYRFCVETGTREDDRDEIAAQSAALLGDSGVRAWERGDLPAAAGLLERSVSLLEENDPSRARRLADLGQALIAAGQLEHATVVLADAVATAARTGSTSIHHEAAISLAGARSWQKEDQHTQLQAVIDAAIPDLAAAGDHLALARAYKWLAEYCNTEGDVAGRRQALEQALHHADAAGATVEATDVLTFLPGLMRIGDTPVETGLRRLDEWLARPAVGIPAQVILYGEIAHAYAMLDRYPEADDAMAKATGLAEEYGLRFQLARLRQGSHQFYTRRALFDAAEREGRWAVQTFAEMGIEGRGTSAALNLSLVLFQQGRHQEADTLVAKTGWRNFDGGLYPLGCRARAWQLLHQGRPDEAAELARQAVDVCFQTIDVEETADTLLDLAQFAHRIGQRDEAVAACQHALALYNQKGDITGARHARQIELLVSAPVDE